VACGSAQAPALLLATPLISPLGSPRAAATSAAAGPPPPAFLVSRPPGRAALGAAVAAPNGADAARASPFATLQTQPGWDPTAAYPIPGAATPSAPRRASLTGGEHSCAGLGAPRDVLAGLGAPRRGSGPSAMPPRAPPPPRCSSEAGACEAVLAHAAAAMPSCFPGPQARAP